MLTPRSFDPFLGESEAESFRQWQKVSLRMFIE